MLITQDCTAQCDQTIESYFIMLRMHTMLNLPKILLAKHAGNTVSTDQWGKPNTVYVLWPHECVNCSQEMCSFISPQVLQHGWVFTTERRQCLWSVVNRRIVWCESSFIHSLTALQDLLFWFVCTSPSKLKVSSLLVNNVWLQKMVHRN